MAYPTNPTSGDTYTLGSKTWTYNGTNWVNQATFASGSSGGGGSVAFSDLTSTPTTLAGYGITDGATGTSESVPVGTVIYHSANTPPTNFIKANGDAVSRTTYSDLFTVIGTTYGVGDGSTTFNVPDLRGEFMRGWDDSRGIDTNRAFGSTQTDEFKSHTHTVYNGTAVDDNRAYSSADATQRLYSGSPNRQTAATGGTETRPRNIALLACIKYQATSGSGSSAGVAFSDLTSTPTTLAGYGITDGGLGGGGSGEQTFTASGSITAGQPVGINPNGTISTASANQSDALNGGSSNTVAKPRMDYDTNANKLVICSQGPSSGYSSYVEVVTPAANLTASFGTPVVSRSSNTDNATPAFDPATGRTNILFVAERSNIQWLYAVSGIVSGTSMTFGSEATGTYNANGDITNPAFINAGSNKSVAVARQDTSNAGLGSSGYQGTVYVLTTSGTSISFGNPVLLDAGVETNNRHGAVYDSNADKVVIFYKDENTTSYARVGTISGTSISLGTRVAFSSTTFQMANTQVYPCFDSNSNKVVLATINSVTNKPFVIVGTVSGTSISFGTPVALNESDAGDIHAAFDSTTNTVNISYYANSGDPGYWLHKVKVNGTSVDIGPKISLTGNSITGPVRYADDIDRTIVLNSSSGGTIAITNPSAPVYVGLAKENISDGATGKVTVIGGINESQSSLITGFPYGLAPTSSTIAVGSSNKIGTALSATKIYLSEGSI